MEACVVGAQSHRPGDESASIRKPLCARGPSSHPKASDAPGDECGDVLDNDLHLLVAPLLIKIMSTFIAQNIM